MKAVRKFFEAILTGIAEILAYLVTCIIVIVFCAVLWLAGTIALAVFTAATLLPLLTVLFLGWIASLIF